MNLKIIQRTRRDHIIEAKTRTCFQFDRRWDVLILRFFDSRIRKFIQDIRINHLINYSVNHRFIANLLSYFVSDFLIFFSFFLSIERNDVWAFFEKMFLFANAFFISLFMRMIIFLAFFFIDWPLIILIECDLILSNILQNSCINDSRWRWVFSDHDKSICTCDFEEINWFFSCLQLIFSIVTKSRRSSALCAKKFAHKDDVIVKNVCEL